MTTRQDLFRQTRHPQDLNDYFHAFNSSNALNVVYWYEYFNMARHLEGDIVECGIGRGRSLITLLSLEALFRTFPGYLHKTIYGLDSFEGFPEPTQEDASPRKPKKGEWSSSPNGQYRYSVENLKKVLSLAEVPAGQLSELILIKGFFNETAATVDTRKIAILHLDGDLYASVRDPLFILADRVVRGGIVVDDYLLHDQNQATEGFPGARKAVEEFLATRNDFVLRESIRGTPYLLRQ